MLYGSAVVLHLSNQGRVELTGDTKDISIEATARNGDRFNLQVGPDKTLTLRADEYEMRIVGRESLELAPSQIRVTRGDTVFIHVRTIDAKRVVAVDNPAIPPAHATSPEAGQHLDTESEAAIATDMAAATVLSKPARIDDGKNVIQQQEKFLDVGNVPIDVAPGFVIGATASGLGDIRDVAVGGNNNLSNEPFVDEVPQQNVYPSIAGEWQEAPGVLFSITQNGSKFTATTTYQHKSAGQIRAVVTGAISKEGKISADMEHLQAPASWAKRQKREATLSPGGTTIRGHAIFNGGEHDFVWTLQP